MDISDYMAEIQKVILLEQPEEEQLWHEYKDKDNMQARGRLIEAYQPLVFKCVRPFCSMESAMDLVQEGTVGLIEAVERYEPAKKVAFSLYAVHRIRGRILNYLNKECGEEQHMSSEEALDAVLALADSEADVQQLAERNFLTSHVKKIMLKLPPKERAVLRGVYLKDQAPQELAENMQVSLSHIYRLQKKAVRRVRGMMAKFMHHWK